MSQSPGAEWVSITWGYLGLGEALSASGHHTALALYLWLAFDCLASVLRHRPTLTIEVGRPRSTHRLAIITPTSSHLPDSQLLRRNTRPTRGHATLSETQITHYRSPKPHWNIRPLELEQRTNIAQYLSSNTDCAYQHPLLDLTSSTQA